MDKCKVTLVLPFFYCRRNQGRFQIFENKNLPYSQLDLKQTKTKKGAMVFMGKMPSSHRHYILQNNYVLKRILYEVSYYTV